VREIYPVAGGSGSGGILLALGIFIVIAAILGIIGTTFRKLQERPLLIGLAVVGLMVLATYFLVAYERSTTGYTVGILPYLGDFIFFGAPVSAAIGAIYLIIDTVITSTIQKSKPK